MSLSAPIGAYAQLCPKTKSTVEEQRTLLALPLTEYTNLQTFKNKFFIDETVIFTNVGKATPDATTFTKGGIMAFVKPGGPNAQHHNLSTTSPSRLSKLRIKKKAGNVETEYQALNDGGLNTTPDVSVKIGAAYSNLLVISDITVKSAYYLNTHGGLDDNGYSAELKINNVQQSNIPYIPDLGVIPMKSMSSGADYENPLTIPINGTIDKKVSFKYGATNDEGTYYDSDEKIMKGACNFNAGIEKVKYLSPNSSFPTTQTEINSLPDKDRFQYQQDANKTNTTDLPEDDGGGGTSAPSDPPKIYGDMYMDNVNSIEYFPVGWFSSGSIDSAHKVTFFHVTNGGVINCYHKYAVTTIVSKSVTLSIQKVLINPDDPDTSLPSGWKKFKLVLERVNDQEPWQQVTVKFQLGCIPLTGSPNYIGSNILIRFVPPTETDQSGVAIASNNIGFLKNLSTGIVEKGPAEKDFYIKNLTSGTVKIHLERDLPLPEHYTYNIGTNDITLTKSAS